MPLRNTFARKALEILLRDWEEQGRKIPMSI
jgi:hypothetical protein